MLDKKTKEIIEAASIKLNINPSAVEKDLYVTKVIALMSAIRNDHFNLLFQGGTCLAKAYRIIQRMSEDCDFRIQLKPSSSLSKDAKRKALREFRHEIIDILNRNGFNISDDELRIRNEGQFMSIRIAYPSEFITAKTMKPYLALEFFLGTVKLPTESKWVTTLIQQTLNETLNYPMATADCIAVTETAAEKWVALTRRIATSLHRNHYRDPNLVRHLYDLYKINQNGDFINKEFKCIVNEIISEDREQFKNHNKDYYEDPIGEIKRTLNELDHDHTWREYWDQFTQVMVFDKHKPTYKEALQNLHIISNKVISLIDIDIV